MDTQEQELTYLQPVVLGKDKDSHAQVNLSYWQRRLGTYLVGGPGTGKTTTLLNLVMQDIASGHGLCVIDPQGKWTEDILSRIPRDRERDVIYFTPADSKRPIGINLFECLNPFDPDLVERIVSEVLIGIFEESWGNMDNMPRMADVLAHTFKTIVLCQSLENPQLRPTLIEIPELIRDENYRKFLLNHIHTHYLPREQSLINWWQRFEAKGGYRQDEQTASTLNKVHRLTDNAMIRRIVGQNRTTLNFREAMDEGKIIIVDLSHGLIGKEAAKLIGTVVISKIYLASLSRVDLVKQRRPLKRFHLVVDEFQNFATNAFAKLQNECRQYAVDIAIAHQNRMGQLAGQVQVHAATLNASNWIIFRAISTDAETLAKGFSTAPKEPEARGERVPLIYSIKAWDVLEERGHENREIVEMTRKISSFGTLHYYLGSALDEYPELRGALGWAKGGEPGWAEHFNVYEGRLDLNRYLYLVMTQADDNPFENGSMSLVFTNGNGHIRNAEDLQVFLARELPEIDFREFIKSEDKLKWLLRPENKVLPLARRLGFEALKRTLEHVLEKKFHRRFDLSNLSDGLAQFSSETMPLLLPGNNSVSEAAAELNAIVRGHVYFRDGGRYSSLNAMANLYDDSLDFSIDRARAELNVLEKRIKDARAGHNESELDRFDKVFELAFQWQGWDWRNLEPPEHYARINKLMTQAKASLKRVKGATEEAERLFREVFPEVRVEALRGLGHRKIRTEIRTIKYRGEYINYKHQIDDGYSVSTDLASFTLAHEGELTYQKVYLDLDYAKAHPEVVSWRGLTLAFLRRKREAIWRQKDKIETIEDFAKIYFLLFMRCKLYELLSRFGELVRQYPVYERGGQPITEYEPRRPYQDVAKERENQIVHLRDFEALVRIQGDTGFSESYIKTIDATLAWVTQADDPTERIKAASRHLYGRDIESVNEELAARAMHSTPRARSTTRQSSQDTTRPDIDDILPIEILDHDADEIKPWNVLE
jgi:hypothetical protein